MRYELVTALCQPRVLQRIECPARVSEQDCPARVSERECPTWLVCIGVVCRLGAVRTRSGIVPTRYGIVPTKGATPPGCGYRLGAVTQAVVTDLSAAPAQGSGTWGGLLKASYHAKPSRNRIVTPPGCGYRLGAVNPNSQRHCAKLATALCHQKSDCYTAWVRLPPGRGQSKIVPALCQTRYGIVPNTLRHRATTWPGRRIASLRLKTSVSAHLVCAMGRYSLPRRCPRIGCARQLVPSL